ncbi:hypothetical protein SLEP1_g28076 [Rubroshorea leprosula]|uniref:beta-fructofuranosidase n=1 Tax=Rubroshorea leprosula TaxID=152421 RepID=A0AAV5JYY7_9ROSI|nr:hypothetical protein SLEP1_g28076 [Rubroshorea leprosula]
MESNTSSHAPFYCPLPDHPSGSGVPRRRPLKGLAGILVSVIFFLSLVAVIINQSRELWPKKEAAEPNSTSEIQNAAVSKVVPRGVAEGVSAKSNPTFWSEGSYNWTNAMLSWQRTAYHFQPERNWMNGRYN